jgi:Ca2+-binding RTX toxin-like protein
MSTTATATYFQKTNYGPFETRTGTLADNDLIRGDDVGEGIIAQGTTSFLLFNGYQTIDFSSIPYRLVDNSPEILATVTFSDGTALTGVRGLFEVITGAYGFATQYFMIDPAALAAAGKTLADVADITRTSATDHDLSWADFGISGDPVDPILPPPPPPPPPPLNRIEGTAANDTLRGTTDDDLIIGNAGRDRLTGRGGEDTFVFGREAGNGVREIDTITDYDAFNDKILLTNNVSIARTIEQGADIIIVLSGADGDRIVLKNQPDSGPLYQVQFDPDFFG